MENDETSPLRKTPKLQKYDSSKRSTPDKSATSSVASAASSSAAAAAAAAAVVTKVPSSFAGALIPVAPTSAARQTNLEKVATTAACGRYTPSSSAAGSATSARSDASVGSSIGSTTLFPSNIRPVGDKMVFAQRSKSGGGGGGIAAGLAAGAAKSRSAGRSPAKGSAGGASSSRSSPSSGRSPSASSSSEGSCPLEVCRQRAGLASSTGRQQAPTGGGGGSTTPRVAATAGKTAATAGRQPMPKIAFEKRSDDECMGGVVRWAEKCERHVVRRQPWNCTRWTESKLQHPNMIGRPAWEPDPNVYVGTTREQKQQPLYSTSKANCDHCDKRFCGGGLNPNFAPPPAHDSPCNCCCGGGGGGGGGGRGSPYDTNNWGQPQGPQQQATGPDNIPFMRAPQCPEDHLFDTPTRCQVRFGMGPPPSSSGGGMQQPPMKGPSGYPSMNQHMVTNVLKIPLTSRQQPTEAANGRNYPAPVASADARFSNIMSHISGFDSQLTVPLNTNYLGYSQKYPQDIIKPGESKNDM